MHEFHLMAQIVKAVEAQLHGTTGVKLSAVRLKVSVLSHLLLHDESALQAAFVMAAHGTKAEGATLEVIPSPSDAWCSLCRRDSTVRRAEDGCSACGGAVMAKSEEPEVVLHELVVQE
jgi:hydrogenase nickel incorporation protein HypA/HybF